MNVNRIVLLLLLMFPTLLFSQITYSYGGYVGNGTSKTIYEPGSYNLVIVTYDLAPGTYYLRLNTDFKGVSAQFVVSY